MKAAVLGAPSPSVSVKTKQKWDLGTQELTQACVLPCFCVFSHEEPFRSDAATRLSWWDPETQADQHRHTRLLRADGCSWVRCSVLKSPVCVAAISSHPEWGLMGGARRLSGSFVMMEYSWQMSSSQESCLLCAAKRTSPASRGRRPWLTS